MGDTTCLVDWCAKPPHAKGMCGAHYQAERAKTMPPCSTPGCVARSFGKGMCKPHYRAARRAATPPKPKPVRVRAVCALPDCGAKVKARDMCGAHYARWRKGKTLTEPLRTWDAAGPCVVCGSRDLMPGSRKFCSARCVRRHYYHDGSPPLTKECVACGEGIDLLAPGVTRGGTVPRKRRSDSAMCAPCRSQATHTRTRFPVRALAKRDGADCRICGDPVDMNLRWPDMGCPTVDHIVSVADLGTHDESNLQLAHFYCNTVKNRRSNWNAV